MRVVNRILAPLVGLAIVAATVIFAVETFADLFGQPAQILGWHGLYQAGERDTWNSDGVRVTLVLIGAIGLVVLLAQLAPHRPGRLTLATDAEGIDAAVSRSSIRTMLVDAATDVDGVDSAKVSLKRRHARVVVRARFGAQEGADALKPEIVEAVNGRLDSLRLARPIRAKVTVRAGGS